MFKYILTGDGYMATPIHSEMNFLEMEDYIRQVSRPSTKREKPCFQLGVWELINPKVMSVNDYANRLPILI